LKLEAGSTRPGGALGEDLYDGRLREMKVPVTFVHGRHDPRTEPGEIERAHEALVGAEARFIENGRHSPHSEKESWRECNGILRELMANK
jgi:pimeloyl-ACP methyl ester carboxylesterase